MKRPFGADMNDMTTPARRSAEKQSGYILATTAILLIPLMIFAAFAVDVGGWYVEADESQRAADAAALAGVVRMPDRVEAAAAAKAVALANGFADQPGCDTLPCTPTSYPQVVVEAAGNRGVRVHIFTEGESAFGKVVLDDIEIERFASAEYVLPVPMGNPTNVLGAATENVEGSVSNYFLRAMGDCVPRAQGDFIGSSGGCPQTNPNYRPEGHKFIVDVPDTGTWEVQARLTCAIVFGDAQANEPMEFTVYPADNTDLDDNDNLNLPILSVVSIADPATSSSPGVCDTNGDGSNNWTPTNEPAPWLTVQADMTTRGHYILFAKNQGTSTNSRSLYALRVVPTGTASDATWTCSRQGATANPDCPNIWAEDFLTTYTNTDMFPAAASPNSELFLADVPEVHRNKTMEVILFDPADGIEFMQILKPDGTVATLRWWTIDCSEYNYPTAGCAGDYGSPTSPISQTCSGLSCLKQEGSYSFQDRTVKLYIDIPNSYSCVQTSGQPDDCWWKVLYVTNGSASETTTWGVRIIGDPVRLTE